jgi:hypothetical protein
MGSAAVPGQLWGTGPRYWAEVAETLVRLSWGNLAAADVVRADGDVMPARGFERRGLRGGGNFGIGSHLGTTLSPVPAISGGLRDQHVRPAR